MRKQVNSDKEMVKKVRNDCRFYSIRAGRKLAVLFFLITVLAAAGCKDTDGQQPTDSTLKEEETKNDNAQLIDETKENKDAANEILGNDSIQMTDETVKKDAEGGSTQSEEKNARSYYGKWKIISGIPGQYSAMSKGEIEARTGTVFEYSEEYAAYGTERLEKPIYQETTVSKAEFAELYRGSSFELLGISKEAVTSVTIENVLDMGSEFYVKDENTLIMVWDGVFFEMERTAD